LTGAPAHTPAARAAQATQYQQTVSHFKDRAAFFPKLKRIPMPAKNDRFFEGSTTNLEHVALSTRRWIAAQAI
jgi:hypothetical protein